MLPLSAIALFGTVLAILCAGGSVDVWDGVPTAFLIALTTLPALAALTLRGHDLFSPFQLVAGYFLIYYGARAADLQLNPLAMRLGLLEYDDYLATAAWIACLTFCSFAVGYMLARSPAPAAYVLRICPRLPQTPPVVRLAVLAGLGIVAHAYILSYGVVIGQTYTQSGMRNMTENPIPGWLPPCSGLVEIAFCLATLYAMSADTPTRDRLMCKWLAWICFLLILFKTFSQGIREYVLLAIALWVLCHHYKRRRVAAGTIAIVLAFALLVFPTIQVFRETLGKMGETPKSAADITDLANGSIDYLRSLSGQDLGNLAMASVFDRSQGIDALSLVVKYTPERAPWGLGASYLTIPMQLFVPRALWADKPILNAHQDFERTYMGIRFFAQASPHVFSDFYSNFSVFGIVIGALAFGVAFKYFYLLRMYAPERKEILFIYAYVVLNAVHHFEAAFVAGAVIMVRVFITIAAVLCFLTWGRTQKNLTKALVH